jgi:hypothetical protein
MVMSVVGKQHLRRAEIVGTRMVRPPEAGLPVND